MRLPWVREIPFDTVVPLRSIPVEGVVADVRARYEAEFGESPDEPGGWYHVHDWRRISFVLRALRPGGRFLDVGLGAGQFINAVAMSDGFDEVHGADPFRFRKYLEFGGAICRIDASVGELPFPDSHFDVVTCMEVLEHVPDEIFEQGLRELRRVCRGQLLMSVPFEEPEPIYRGHRRRFAAADIVHHFPNAERALLYRPLAPWALLEEWCEPGSSHAPESEMLRASRDYCARFGALARVRSALGMRTASTARAARRRLRR